MASRWGFIAGHALRLAVREGPRLLRQVQRSRRTPGRPGSQSSPRSDPTRPRPPEATTARSTPPAGRHLDYAPDLDGRADPGEIVWTWVAYEEDAGQGKDRPVLVVGREDATLLGLMLSSQGYHEGESSWLPLGAGPWDKEGRPSWLRLDRVLQVPEAGIRREGAVLDRDRFHRVAAALRAEHGWR